MSEFNLARRMNLKMKKYCSDPGVMCCGQFPTLCKEVNVYMYCMGEVLICN